MKRYRIWEAAREVFLFPENWLVETQRPSRTEIYKKLEQDVHQNDYTSDNFETVTLNYLDGLENIAHLQVTGTCGNPNTGDIMHTANVAFPNLKIGALCLLGYGFENAWEIVPGVWTEQIWYQDRMLAERTFTVSRPERGDRFRRLRSRASSLPGAARLGGDLRFLNDHRKQTPIASTYQFPSVGEGGACREGRAGG